MKARTFIFGLLFISSICSAENKALFSIKIERDKGELTQEGVRKEEQKETNAVESKEQNPSIKKSDERTKLTRKEKPIETIKLQPVSTTHDQTSPNSAGRAMLVLDMSGSMWGEINGRTKVEIEKEIVLSTISDWDDQVDLGLMSYGHNRKGDCSDIEQLIAPSKIDFTKFEQAINALQPKGKTPMSAAVQQAAKALRHSEEKATVILVSDGKETCSLDPCAVGKELEASGVDFTAHIIGFDVPEEDTTGMRCLAEATGGVFIAADNADALKEALNQAKSLAIKPVVEEKDSGAEASQLKLDPATVDVPDEVEAGSAFLVEWTGPKNKNDRLYITSPNIENPFNKPLDIERVITDDETQGFPAIKMTAPEEPGEYIASYRTQAGDVLGQDSFRVIPTTASITLPAEVTAGADFNVTWSGPQNDRDQIIFINSKGERSGHNIPIQYYSETSQKQYSAPLLAGTYRAQYVTKNGKIIAESAYEVVSAKITIDAPDQVIAGSTFGVAWAGPQNKNDRLKITKANVNKNYHSISISNRKKVSSPSLLRAPEAPGIYSVHYWVLYKDESLAVDQFEVIPATASVKAPKVVEADETFLVEWSGQGNLGDQIKILRLKDNKLKGFKTVYKKNKPQNPLKFRAPKEVGEYKIVYITPKENILASQPLRVK